MGLGVYLEEWNLIELIFYMKYYFNFSMVQNFLSVLLILGFCIEMRLVVPWVD